MDKNLEDLTPLDVLAYIKELEEIALINEGHYRELEVQLEKAETEVILRGENFNRVKAQNEIMRETLDNILIMVYDQRWNDIEYAIEALKKVKDAE